MRKLPHTTFKEASEFFHLCLEEHVLLSLGQVLLHNFALVLGLFEAISTLLSLMLILDALGNFLGILDVVAVVHVVGIHAKFLSSFSVKLKNCDSLPCRRKLMPSKVFVMWFWVPEVISKGPGSAVLVKVDCDPDVVELVHGNR